METDLVYCLVLSHLFFTLLKKNSRNIGKNLMKTKHQMKLSYPTLIRIIIFEKMLRKLNIFLYSY